MMPTKPAKIQNFFETVAIPIDSAPPPKRRITKQVRPQGQFRSRNFTIHPPELEPEDFFRERKAKQLKKAQIKSFAEQLIREKVKKTAPKPKHAFYWVSFGAGICLAAAFLFSSGMAGHYFLMKQEVKDILSELQSAQREKEAMTQSFQNVQDNYKLLNSEYINLIQEGERLKEKMTNELGFYAERSKRLNDLNQFLLDRVVAQEMDLNDISFTVTEQLADLKKQVDEDQLALYQQEQQALQEDLEEVAEKRKQKPYREFFYDSYEKPENE